MRRFEDYACVALVLACIISLCMMFHTCEQKKNGTVRGGQGETREAPPTGPHIQTRCKCFKVC